MTIHYCTTIRLLQNDQNIADKEVCVDTEYEDKYTFDDLVIDIMTRGNTDGRNVHKCDEFEHLSIINYMHNFVPMVGTTQMQGDKQVSERSPPCAI